MKRLREVEERYEAAMGAIKEGIYDWNISENRVYFAGALEDVLGLAPGVLKDSFKEWHERIHPEDFGRFREATIAHLKGATDRFECDYRYRARDGSWHWARTHGLAIRDASGRAVRMIGSTGEITELKRVEEALRESEERYALATRAATEGIYEWNVETGALFISDRAREFFGLPAGPLTNMAWNERIHPDDFQGYRSAVIEHFRGNAPQIECEYRARDADGRYRWVLDRGRAVRNAQGRVMKLIGAESDITQRKEAEIELRRARDEAEEALEQQTATAEVLRVMSESQTDVQPVFDAIARSAVRLCEGLHCSLFRLEGGLQHFVAHAGVEAGTLERLRKRYPRPPHAGTVTGRALLERTVLNLEDIQADERFAESHVVMGGAGYHAALAVPMFKQGVPVGIILVVRREARAFSSKQVELLRTFADQAVIAIENVRLFNETKESLEQQRAAGAVLHVISSSIADTAPVFDKILESCQRLFAGTIVGLNLVREDGMLHIGAYHGAHREEFERIFPIPLTRESGSGLSIVERRVVHYPDAASEDVPARTRQGCKTIGIKSAIFAPVLWEGRGVGAIFVGRDHVSSFSEKEIALLRTFADQAAIAIENVRLFNETKEALEQQKALAEVLGAMSGSIADTKPVFDEILDSCQRLFRGHQVGLTLAGEDGLVHLGAYKGEHKERIEAVYPYPLDRDSGSGQAMLDRKVVQFDRIGSPESDAPPHVVRGAQAVGVKSLVFAPLIAEAQAIGALWVGRHHPGPFGAKETALLETFADQAVIAIRNARLFREIQEKSRQLEVASRHKSEFLANMSHELRTPLNAIIGFTRIVMRRTQESLEPKQYDNLEKILASGEHLLALINSILDLSKIEAGRIDVRPGEVGLAPVLEHCVRTVEPLAKVALVKEFDSELPRMYVDEEKLRQIVINLLSNAAKFTEEGAIRLKAYAANGSVAIAVSDTGIGIPPDKLELIFEEFEQVDATRTRVHGGTGLGLAIARRLARLMGGDITAESALGSGSTFRLTLPLRYSAPA